MISMIVAAAENQVIGLDNQLPWRLSKDLQFFKNKTWGSPIIVKPMNL
jgi:dihydrofolate reductase